MGKVVVTGAGIISAIGVGLDATLHSLRRGHCGIGRCVHLPTALNEFPMGEVQLSDADMARMTGAAAPADRMRTVLLGIIAAREAISTSGLDNLRLSRAAFINGTTVGGMDVTERHFKEVAEAGGDTPAAIVMRSNHCGSATEEITAMIGQVACATTISTACSSAANAIIAGAGMIKAGVTDTVIAGGAEALTLFHLNGFNSLMILDREECRPFDRDRAGINLGEGAAYLVLESEEAARARGAAVMATLSGYANACDAFHQTATSPDGEGAFLAMSGALEMAGLTPAEIGYVNAHGTGTPDNDAGELAAMRRIWGSGLPPYSSTKALTGHTTSASGAIEAVISILSLIHGIIPANRGWSHPIGDYPAPVTATVTGIGLDHVIDNSFGFGGNDSSLIFSKHTPA